MLDFKPQVLASRNFVVGEKFVIDPLATSADPNSGKPIVYSSLNTAVCTVENGEVIMVAPGACEIAANQAGDNQYAAAKQVTQVVALNAQKSYSGTSVPSNGGTPGTATASFTGGGEACRFDPQSTGFITAPATRPKGKVLSQGVFEFKLIDCDTSAEPVTMTTTWPQPVKGYAKYGKATPDASASSYFEPTDLSIRGNTVTFTVRDGQKGDDDWTVNGDIVDPSGPTEEVSETISTPPAAVGQPYTFTVPAAASGPVSFSATGLPAGLSIDPITGVISGTPTQAGVSTVTITINSPEGNSTQTITVDVGPAVDRVTPVPALGEWGLMLLGLLAAGLGARRLRR